MHELAAFANGSGYYQGLGVEIRQAQIAHLAELTDQLYPQLRLFLFDAQRAFSAPLSVFGPQLAVIYVGRFYLAFRERQRVQSFIRHFDWLVREAKVADRDSAAHLRNLVIEDR